MLQENTMNLNGLSHDEKKQKISRRELTGEIKKYAKSLGADIVGISPMERFEGAPKQSNGIWRHHLYFHAGSGG
jgi:hypothetical protein